METQLNLLGIDTPARGRTYVEGAKEYIGVVYGSPVSPVFGGIKELSTLPLVCFARDNLNTTEFLSRLYERQIAWISEVRLPGGPSALRACITSFRTTEADLEWITREMGKLL